MCKWGNRLVEKNERKEYRLLVDGSSNHVNHVDEMSLDNK